MTQYPPPGAPDDQAPPGPPAGPPPGTPSGPPPGPTWGQPGTPPWGPPVQQPGVVPLRPLLLGDLFGGALQTVRRSPRATIGLAAAVTFAFMLLPTIGTLVLGAGGDLPSLVPSAEDSGNGLDGGDVGLLVSTAVSGIFQLLSSLVVTGLIVRIVEAAVMGESLDAGAAWRRSRGRLAPLLGMTLLVAVALTLVLGLPIAIGIAVGVLAGSTPLAIGLGVLGGLVGLVGCCFIFTRYVLLAAPVLVLEGRGVLASLARAGQLSRGQFWRLFGIYLLTGLVTGVVSQVVSIPFAVVGVVGALALPDSWAVASVLLSSNLATVLTGALIGPFSAGVLALQYYDQRFRKEGLDIQLLNQSLRARPW